MRYPIILSIVLTTLAGCTYQSERSTRFTPQEAREMLKQCSRRSAPPAEDLWRIPPSMARALDRNLGQIKTSPTWKSHLTPNAFYRQYIGITSRGRKVVYINAFSPVAMDMYQSRPGPGPNRAQNWRHMYIGACDGGDSFWGAVYDPQTRQFTELDFNFGV